MAVGLPSVVSDIPANRQLVEDGVHGRLARAADPASLAASLTQLLADPEGRARMGQAARRLVLENYSTEKIVARYESLFDEAISGPPKK